MAVHLQTDSFQLWMTIFISSFLGSPLKWVADAWVTDQIREASPHKERKWIQWLTEPLHLILLLSPSLCWFKVDSPKVFLSVSFGIPCFCVWWKQTSHTNICTVIICELSDTHPSGSRLRATALSYGTLQLNQLVAEVMEWEALPGSLRLSLCFWGTLHILLLSNTEQAIHSY